ncbi:hypothetical protein [Romboutsia sp. MSSM.1001216sp_RTP31141st1_G3_RTP31141_220114]|uniref:hypothetical protein n=1 Tax=unclassified Romboutsia TaxID=2626894 RepID=UPI0031B5C128
MQELRISIERRSQEETNTLIDSFKICGWEYHGNYNFVDTHIFAVFTWSQNSEPIYPEGYEQHKAVYPVHSQGIN